MDRPGSNLMVYHEHITTNVVSSNPAQARCTRHNIMWKSLSVTCVRSVFLKTCT